MKRLRHFLTATAAIILASCSTTPQQQDETPAETPATKKEQKATTVTPTAEQQTAAEALLVPEKSGVTYVEATQSTLQLPSEAPAYEAPTYQPTTSIPGRSGLRMGHFAPPEEAASTGENKAPTPNAVDMHGLRSPSLPKNLPLDVNGQSKKN